MNVPIIHLSDLHISTETTLPDTRIIDIVKSLHTLPQFKHVIIVISGDVAFSGKEEEYNIAYKKIKTLEDKIAEEFSTEKIDVILVPGNHDNDYANQPFTREQIASVLNKEQNYKYEAKKLSAFYNFAAKFDCFQKNKLTDIKQITIGKHKIQFILLNSAIYSAFRDPLGQNEKGLHYIPRHTMEIIEKLSKNSMYTIYVSHHSPEWFDEESKHLIEEFIGRKCSLALWGHEHYFGCYLNGANIIKGGVLSGEDHHSDFYIISIDLEKNQTTADHYEYNERDRLYVGKPYDFLMMAGRENMQPNQTFIDTFISNDIPTLKCKVKDIFVFPRLLQKNNSFDLEDEIIAKDQFLEDLENKQTCLIAGGELSGKTALLKELYLTYLEKGFMPIYLTPESIKGKKTDRIIKYSFYEQYAEDDACYQNYVQLPKGKKILFIDDIHLITTQKAFNDFLTAAQEQFSKIIMASDDCDFDVENIIKSHIDDSGIMRCSISPFYMDKRKELIFRVINVMGKYTEGEIGFYVERIDKTIQNQLKYFSLTPQFIILYVDYFLNQVVSLDGNSNVFNAVFQANITNMLKSVQGTTLSRVLQILQNIAYYIHTNGDYPLSYSKFVDIIEEFNKEHAKTMNAQSLTESLVKAGIIVLIGDEIRFTSDNYLAYFIAQALNGKLGTEEGNSQIGFLIKNICFGINADIILFLSFLTNRKELIGFILDEIDSFLQGWEECDLDAHNIRCLFVDFNAPQISYPSSEQKAQRTKDMIRHEQEIKDDDTIEASGIYQYDPDDIQYYVNKQKKILRLLEVTAKILPNFEHMLSKPEMMTIVDKLYSIPNKLIYYMLKPFDDNFEVFVNELERSINKNRVEDEKIDKMQCIVLIQDIFTAVILSLYDFTSRLAATDETCQLLLDPQYSKSLANKIQQCLVLYQFDDCYKLGQLIEDIYDNTDTKSVRFMMVKIARNYLLMHNVPYRHYGQKFIDKFFPDRKKLMLERSKLNNKK